MFQTSFIHSDSIQTGEFLLVNHPAILLFIYLFNKYLLNAYYVVGSMPCSGDTVMEKLSVQSGQSTSR